MAIKTTRRRSTSPDDPTTAYARAIVSGKIVAGPHVRDECARHLRDLKEGSRRGLFFDVAAAERFFGFCRDVLRLSEGQFDGLPFELEPSQKFICGSLFGWKWKRSGLRRSRRAYIEQGKGNGKSPMVGAIGLYRLSQYGAGYRQNRCLCQLAAHAEEGGDVVCSCETHPSARTAQPTRPQWRTRRIPARRHCPEPAQASQATRYARPGLSRTGGDVEACQSRLALHRRKPDFFTFSTVCANCDRGGDGELSCEADARVFKAGPLLKSLWAGGSPWTEHRWVSGTTRAGR